MQSIIERAQVRRDFFLQIPGEKSEGLTGLPPLGEPI
jgi:hypothetical protein